MRETHIVIKGYLQYVLSTGLYLTGLWVSTHLLLGYMPCFLQMNPRFKLNEIFVSPHKPNKIFILYFRRNLYCICIDLNLKNRLSKLFSNYIYFSDGYKSRSIFQTSLHFIDFFIPVFHHKNREFLWFDWLLFSMY